VLQEGGRAGPLVGLGQARQVPSLKLLLLMKMMMMLLLFLLLLLLLLLVFLYFSKQRVSLTFGHPSEFHG